MACQLYQFLSGTPLVTARNRVTAHAVAVTSRRALASQKVARRRKALPGSERVPERKSQQVLEWWPVRHRSRSRLQDRAWLLPARPPGLAAPARLPAPLQAQHAEQVPVRAGVARLRAPAPALPLLRGEPVVVVP